MLTGGCFCGAVRYKIERADYACANCHCTMCRRISGAPYVSWLIIPAEEFEWSTSTATRLSSSPGAERYFCKSCGTGLTCISEGHKEVVHLTLGSLDTPEVITPTMEAYVDTKLAWVDHIAKMKQL